MSAPRLVPNLGLPRPLLAQHWVHVFVAALVVGVEDELEVAELLDAWAPDGLLDR